jgi:hypothetical protein
MQEDDQPLNFGTLAKPNRVAAAGEVKPMAKPAAASFAEADDDRDRCNIIQLGSCVPASRWRVVAARM